MASISVDNDHDVIRVYVESIQFWQERTAVGVPGARVHLAAAAAKLAQYLTNTNTPEGN